MQRSGLLLLSACMFLVYSTHIRIHAHEDGHTLMMVFMAAANDLFPFSLRNTKQMQMIGSNKNITIVIHVDMQRPNQPKVSRRYVVEKNNLVQQGNDYSMDSGNPDTLLSFCRWAIQTYPAQHHALVLWNHGTGVLDPVLRRAVNPSGLFSYNPTTKFIELNRSVGFIDYITKGVEQDLLEEEYTPHLEHPEHRGICFDDSTGNYLTNQSLKKVLSTVCKEYLGGKKLSCLLCDACLMSMIEVAAPLKDYVRYFVASQEVELGTGYNYATVLTPFLTQKMDPKAFALHVVSAFHDTYSKITNDFTHAALDLSQIQYFEPCVDTLAQQLILGLKKQKNKSVKETIRVCRSRNMCTHFDEPTYIDLGHFCENLLAHLHQCELTTPQETDQYRKTLQQSLQQTVNAQNKLVIAHTEGRNLKNAHGISIYFPERNTIHRSYYHSEFAQKTHWLEFLNIYSKTV